MVTQTIQLHVNTQTIKLWTHSLSNCRHTHYQVLKLFPVQGTGRTDRRTKQRLYMLPPLESIFFLYTHTLSKSAKTVTELTL